MNRNEWAEQTARQLLVEHGAILRNWPRVHLEIWLRDNCRCVYCARDLLQDRDITYFLYSYDHLLPVNKYPELRRAPWNRVVACRACNSWKSSFDPSEPGISPNEAARDTLIERSRAYIQERRKMAEALFLREREILIAALEQYGVGKAAGA